MKERQKEKAEKCFFLHKDKKTTTKSLKRTKERQKVKSIKVFGHKDRKTKTISRG